MTKHVAMTGSSVANPSSTVVFTKQVPVLAAIFVLIPKVIAKELAFAA